MSSFEIISPDSLHVRLDFLLNKLSDGGFREEALGKLRENLFFKSSDDRQQHLLCAYRSYLFGNPTDDYWHDAIDTDVAHKIERDYQDLLQRFGGEFAVMSETRTRIMVDVISFMSEKLQIKPDKVIETHSVGSPIPTLAFPESKITSLSLEQNLFTWSFLHLPPSFLEILGMRDVLNIDPDELDEYSHEKIASIFKLLFPNHDNISCLDSTYLASCGEKSFDLAILQGVVHLQKNMAGFPSYTDALRKGIGHFVKIGGHVIISDFYHTLSGASGGHREYGGLRVNGSYREILIEDIEYLLGVNFQNNYISCLGVRLFQRVK